MLLTLLGFYEQYPSNILALRQIRRATLGPELLEELDYHGKKQRERSCARRRSTCSMSRLS